MAQLEKVRVDEAAGALEEFWSQRVVGRANGNLLKVARADGEVHLLLVGPEITSNEAGGKPAWSHDRGEPPADGG